MLECPQCRQQHITFEGIKAFRENEYILDHLKDLEALGQQSTWEQLEKTGILSSNLESVKEELKSFIDALTSTKQNIKEKVRLTLNEIEKRKIELIKGLPDIFEDMKETVLEQMSGTSTDIDVQVSMIQQNISVLERIDEVVHDEANKIQLVKDIKNNTLSSLDIEKYKYYEYYDRRDTLSKGLYVTLRSKELSVNIGSSFSKICSTGKSTTWVAEIT